MDNRRIFLTIAISIAIIFVWFKIFPPPKEQPAPPPAPPATTTPAASTTTPAKVTTANQPPPGAARPAESRITVQRDGQWRAVFTSWGASPVEWTLLDKQYQERVWLPKPGTPQGSVRVSDDDPNFQPTWAQINLVKPQAGPPPFLISFPDSDLDLPTDAAWTLVSQTDDELVYALDAGALHVEKHWKLPRSGYQVGLDVVLENRGDKALNEHLFTSVTGWQAPGVKHSSFSFGKRVNFTQAECDVAGKLHKQQLDDATAKPETESGDVRWVGTGEQFFLTAVAFAPSEAGTARRCTLHGDPSGRLAADAYFAGRTLAPHAKVVVPMQAYLGPKLLHALDAVSVAGADAHLGDAVNYTLEFVARPLLFVLKLIQRGVRNWGLAIIVITVLLKLAVFWPTQKSMASARAMAALKPELDKLKARFPDDKQKQNVETMNLYKKHGVNPLGGCLPMLIQMPLYIAFYSMLANSVEIYRAHFVGPIDDLTAPWWPLAVITGVIMFVQSRITPQPADNQQAKMMMYVMPIMFLVMTIFLPSGLTLYILANTLLGIAQQAYFNQKHPLPSPVPAGPAPKPAAATTTKKGK